MGSSIVIIVIRIAQGHRVQNVVHVDLRELFKPNSSIPSK
jgi:hypothetical protein